MAIDTVTTPKSTSKSAAAPSTPSPAAAPSPAATAAAKATSPPPPSSSPKATKVTDPKGAADLPKDDAGETPSKDEKALKADLDKKARAATQEPEETADPFEDKPVVDRDTFDQILELDEDEDDREFSREMAVAYFDQASTTFKDMEKALAKEDLKRLSELGHFLKGSSAALGLSRVQASCERMQHYGHLRDEDRDIDLTPPIALKKIRPLLSQAKLQYVEAEKWLKDFYGLTD